MFVEIYKIVGLLDSMTITFANMKLSSYFVEMSNPVHPRAVVVWLISLNASIFNLMFIACNQGDA